MSNDLKIESRVLQSQASNSRESIGQDVRLKDLLDIPEPFVLQSPLPQLTTEEKRRRQHEELSVENPTAFDQADDCYQLQDVQLKDILHAPSMDISLKTATDLDS